MERAYLLSFVNFYSPQALENLSAAWVWLEVEGFIAPEHRKTRDWVFVTQRGVKALASKDLKKFMAAKLLPKKGLDPKIEERVAPLFIRGDYDLAVFAAFREVEITVRELGGFGTEDIGVHLMRKAFKPKSGPLTDTEQTEGEQQGLCDLYAGAMGVLKNPGSHRNVNFEDPIEAAESIMFAALLIRIAKRRKTNEGSQA